MKEWPLILFTLATQLACGLTMAATLFEANVPAADLNLMRPLAMAIFPVLAMGILLSVAHLGRPMLSWRALANPRHSRLSHEVLLTAVFALLALAHSGCWWMGITEGRWLVGAAASAAGIAAVIGSAVLYQIPSQPAWNSGWVPASFLGTAVLLGGLAPAVLIAWRADTGLLRAFLLAALAGGLLLSVAAFWMVANLSRSGNDPFTANRLTGLMLSLNSRSFFWLGCHVVLVSVLPAVIAFRLWSGSSVGITLSAGIVFAAALVGAAIGRAIMYWLGTLYEPF